MDMKVNSQLIRKLREDRAWSQEHLAEVSGLSARTIQRIETEGNASAETRMALAAALGIDVATLAAADVPAAAGGAPAAPAPVVPRRGLWRHVAIYLVVCSGLIILDLSRGGAITWSKWPLLGWGLGLLLHRWRLREAAGAAHTAP